MSKDESACYILHMGHFCLQETENPPYKELNNMDMLSLHKLRRSEGLRAALGLAGLEAVAHQGPRLLPGPGHAVSPPGPEPQVCTLTIAGRFHSCVRHLLTQQRPEAEIEEQNGFLPIASLRDRTPGPGTPADLLSCYLGQNRIPCMFFRPVAGGGNGPT